MRMFASRRIFGTFGLAILFLLGVGASPEGTPCFARQDDLFLFVLACPGLAHNGAGTLDVRLTEAGNATLRGVVGREVIWEKPFPLPETINPAKTTVECDGGGITFASQFPGTATTRLMTFTWDGETIKLTGTRTQDLSAETVERIIRAAEDGDTETLERLKGSDETLILYPQHYITPQILAEALARGQKAAAEVAKTGKPKEAAERLSLMFETTLLLAANLDATELPENAPARWLQSWKTMKVPVKDFIGPLNDYGYFLQQAKDHGTAIVIFSEVLKLSPGRIVAYLNLADSQWDFGFIEEAKANYRMYQSLMFDRGRTRAVPVRVIQRLGKG